jgi:hypothetical protein
MICTNCGDDEATEGYRTCTECLEAGVFDPGEPDSGLLQIIDELARDLLRMHHDTGISLDAWHNARRFIDVAGYDLPPRNHA